MSQSEIRDVDVIESLLPEYEAEGFQVYINPSPSILPPFLHAFRPDAVALRSDKKIAIEVVRSTAQTPSRKVEDLQSLFATQKDWELRVIYASPLTSGKTLEIVSKEFLQDSIRRIVELKKGGHLLPALVMAWATLEALGRALLPSQLGRPQTASRLVEVLAEAGYLTPQEAEQLRPAIALRNAAVHGGLDQQIDEKQVDQLIAVLQTLFGILTTRRIHP